MIAPIQVRGLTIGPGRPAIAVPIVGRDRREVLSQAETAMVACADLLEWRADFLEDMGPLLSIAGELRGKVGDMPLLFTLRTVSEGGNARLDADAYDALNLAAAASGLVDVVDVEIMNHPDARSQVARLHEHGVYVLGSNHDFFATPGQAEIVRRLCHMQDVGCDVLKIAVTPVCAADVLTLLAATLDMKEHHARRPLVTMSMKPLGAVTRLAGEVFGSCITFGTAGMASAPGQIPAERLKTAMTILHDAIQ